MDFANVERGMDSDFALALLLDCLARRRELSIRDGTPRLKLLVMSATMSTETFQGFLVRQVFGKGAEGEL